MFRRDKHVHCGPILAEIVRTQQAFFERGLKELREHFEKELRHEAGERIADWCDLTNKIVALGSGRTRPDAPEHSILVHEGRAYIRTIVDGFAEWTPTHDAFAGALPDDLARDGEVIFTPEVP